MNREDYEAFEQLLQDDAEYEYSIGCISTDDLLKVYEEAEMPKEAWLMED